MSFRVVVWICIATLLTGCETELTQISEKLPPAPPIELGQQFQVLKAPRYGYHTEGITDAQGRVHLIVVLKKAVAPAPSASATPAERERLRHDAVMEVRHFVIGPRGVISSEVVRYVKSNPLSLDFDYEVTRHSLDLAFDRAGKLHALVNGEHLILRDGVWVGGQRTPWQEAGVQPICTKFVRGAKDLTWSFDVNGSAMGIGDISEWTIVSAGGGIGPYHRTIDVTRSVVVPEETPYRHWKVLNMESNDTSNVTLVAADRRQAIHALYDMSELGGLWILRYAAFRADGACPKSSPHAWYRKFALKLPDGTPVCPIVGSPFSAGDPDPFLKPKQRIGPQIQVPQPVANMGPAIYEMDFAMDPESGAVLMAQQNGSSILVGDARQSAKWIDMPIRNAGFLLEPAGGDRFHALATGLDDYKSEMPVYYLEYSASGWSAPVQVGHYANPFFQGHQDPPSEPRRDAFRIIPDNNGHALLLWPHEDALVARWVTLKK